MIPALIVGKLSAGLSALALALWLTRSKSQKKTKKEQHHV